jgi:hypothetical protein
MVTSRRISRVVAAFVAVLTVSFAVSAEPQNTAKSDFTTLDYYQIKQQIARACHGLDSGMDGGNLFANAFTPEGVFVSEDGNTYVGRARLAQLARTDTPGATMKKGPTNASHFMTSVAIEPTATGAIAKGHILISTNEAGARPGARGRGTITDMGQYWDEMVKTPDGWRIAKRTFHRASM